MYDIMYNFPITGFVESFFAGTSRKMGSINNPAIFLPGQFSVHAYYTCFKSHERIVLLFRSEQNIFLLSFVDSSREDLINQSVISPLRGKYTDEEHLAMAAEPTIDSLHQRLARLHAGHPLRVVDLFSGCGGMSLGLQQAGFHILGGVEFNRQASKTYATNLFRGLPDTEIERHAIPHDITQFSPSQFLHEVLNQQSPENLVDVIAGGPPCQAFSRIGRAKLGHLNGDPDAYRADQRSGLYLHYLEYVKFFRPLAVVMENVPDIMNYGGQNIAEDIVRSLKDQGYLCSYTILNTVHYGVPQFRQRFYLLALRHELGITPSFPPSTHHLDMVPAGYETARNVALKTISQRKASNQQAVQMVLDTMTVSVHKHHYLDHVPSQDSTQHLAVTTREALADLPILQDHLEGPQQRHPVDTSPQPYRTDIDPSLYAEHLRQGQRGGVTHHVIRMLPRDYPIFRDMQPNDQYPQAHAIAIKAFQQKLQAYEQEHQCVLTEDSAEYAELYKKIVPPYPSDKFPNKWWKLDPDRPSRTLTAHMGKDTYSHIHYDSSQARVISVREAARLQSFPDNFIFACAMNAAYTMIGNAVAPRQAYALGSHLKQLLLMTAQAPAVAPLPITEPLCPASCDTEIVNTVSSSEEVLSAVELPNYRAIREATRE